MRLVARLFVSAVCIKHHETLQNQEKVSNAVENRRLRAQGIPACEAGLATCRALGGGSVDGWGCEVM